MAETLVHSHIFDPSGPRLFKGGKNDKSFAWRIYCTNTDCPLLKQGCCIMGGVQVFPDNCPYGRTERRQGFTRRHSKSYQFLSEQREIGKGVPYLDAPPHKMAIIGDYIYLPYSHIEGGFVKDGPAKRVMPLSEWTVELVIAILQYQPQALFGGAIASYQKEEMPRFLLHLPEVDPAMYAALIERCPQYNVKRSNVGRKAVLKTLNHPIEIGAKDHRYPVVWTWDGEVLRTNSKHAYNSTWGGFDSFSGATTEIVPSDKATVKVESDDWVNPDTVFID